MCAGSQDCPWRGDESQCPQGCGDEYQYDIEEVIEVMEE